MEDEGDIAAVSGLAEDLRDVLLEHWVSVNPKNTNTDVWPLKRSVWIDVATTGCLRSKLWVDSKSHGW